MIPYSVRYLRAETADEAVHAWKDADDSGSRAVYYGGGTEIVTLSREHKFRADMFIDYKHIPEARRRPDGGNAAWGSALRLNEIADAGDCRLLGLCCAGIADRTVRNSITLGGNMCGMLPYREAVLPFLLLDGHVNTVGPDGSGTREEVTKKFAKKMNLRGGELIVSFDLDRDVVRGLEEKGVTRSGRSWGPLEAWASGPRGGWFYARRTKEPRVDYPLVTLLMAQVDGVYRLALTGTFGYPLRAYKAEEVLNSALGGGPGTKGGIPAGGNDLRSLAEEVLDAEGLKYKDDMRGGASYRREMTVQSIVAGVKRLGETVVQK